ncbi:hypothetical protein LUD75_17060 [Epilithonimonas sp. JDS]|uniref:hypothetical protein n=1 Tax=Epilithonimonas sp. JDS TaxID=2902797 RepID=UPI001E513015|nr:hypothetical protein [Epilithonimonas sp. JDS]MCD9856435.1 hypothetical protein [Epilithonimonas sp. JDS]
MQNGEDLNFIEKFKTFFTNRKIEQRRKNISIIRVNINNSTKFSPIYDSGCCLAREKTDEEIIKMNNDDLLIEKYVIKGKSEIHWEGNKINHFQLIQNLLPLHQETIENRFKVIRNRYNIEKLKTLINKIDNSLPDFCYDYKLTKDRKEVIVKIVDLRIQKLLSLL